MAWGPPKTPKQKTGYNSARRGGAAAPYDHVDAKDDSLDDDEGIVLDFDDPDPDCNVITPRRTLAMTEMVKVGVPVHVAAAAIGIKGELWKSWSKTARVHKEKSLEGGFEKGQSPYVYWLDQVHAAKAQYEASLIACIGNAASHDWKAAAWMLERFAASRWHLASKLELSAKSGDKVDIQSLPTAQLLALAKGGTPALTAGPEDAEVVSEQEQEESET